MFVPKPRTSYLHFCWLCLGLFTYPHNFLLLTFFFPGSLYQACPLLAKLMYNPFIFCSPLLFTFLIFSLSASVAYSSYKIFSILFFHSELWFLIYTWNSFPIQWGNKLSSFISIWRTHLLCIFDTNMPTKLF